MEHRRAGYAKHNLLSTSSLRSWGSSKDTTCAAFSSTDSTVRSDAERLAARHHVLLTPVRSSVAVERLLGQPGAPPRQAPPLVLCQESFSDGGESVDIDELLLGGRGRRHFADEEPWTPQVPVPRVAKFRHRHRHLLRPVPALGGGESVSSLSYESSHASSSRTTSEQPPRRAPSPSQVLDILRTRDFLGKSFISRAEFDTAVLEEDCERSDFAHHRMEAKRAAQEVDRQQAVKWREVDERRRQLYELQWQFKDPQKRKVFENEEENERHVPSPEEESVPEGGGSLHDPAMSVDTDDYDEFTGPKSARNATMLKPRKPLHLRLRGLEKKARAKRKAQQAQARSRPDSDYMWVLTVTIESARGLPNADAKNLSDPYCVCEVSGNKRTEAHITTPVIQNSLDPDWDHTGEVTDFDPSESLVFSVFDKDIGNKDDFLGRLTLVPAQFYPNGFDGEMALEQLTPGLVESACLKVSVGAARRVLRPLADLMKPAASPEQAPSRRSSGAEAEESKAASPNSAQTPDESRAGTAPGSGEPRARGRRQSQMVDTDAVVLKNMFAKCDQDQNGFLDHAELHDCLAMLGLRPKNSIERDETRKILYALDSLQFDFDTFSTQIVPQVRTAFRECRRPRLVHFFHDIDACAKGYVSHEDAMTALRRHGMFVSESVFEEANRAFMLQSCRDGKLNLMRKSVLDVDGFVMFLSTLQEHHDRDQAEAFNNIVTTFNLPPEQREIWRWDLVDLYRMFHEYDPCSGKFGSATGVMGEQEVITVLRESGYMPKTRAKQTQVASQISRSMRADATLGFMEFLALMQTLREFDRERLRKTIEVACSSSRKTPSGGAGTRGLDRSRAVHWSELSDLVADCGIVPRNGDERQEMRLIMEDCGGSGSGVLSREEVVIACQRINAKLRLMQRERERQYVLSAGWTEQNFAEFRQTFQSFDEDMSEVLEKDELMKAIEVLKGHYWQSSQNINLMFMALGIDPNKEIRVNFLMFLRVIKMLDESEARRQHGAGLGFSRDITDKIYSAFQALEPEAAGSIRRETVERALSSATSRFISKLQLVELSRGLGPEQAQVDFNAFIKVMKTLEGLTDAGFEDCLDEILNYRTREIVFDIDAVKAGEDNSKFGSLSKLLN